MSLSNQRSVLDAGYCRRNVLSLCRINPGKGVLQSVDSSAGSGSGNEARGVGGAGGMSAAGSGGGGRGTKRLSGSGVGSAAGQTV